MEWCSSGGECRESEERRGECSLAVLGIVYVVAWQAATALTRGEGTGRAGMGSSPPYSGQADEGGPVEIVGELVDLPPGADCIMGELPLGGQCDQSTGDQ